MHPSNVAVHLLGFDDKQRDAVLVQGITACLDAPLPDGAVVRRLAEKVLALTAFRLGNNAAEHGCLGAIIVPGGVAVFEPIR